MKKRIVFVVVFMFIIYLIINMPYKIKILKPDKYVSVSGLYFGDYECNTTDEKKIVKFINYVNNLKKFRLFIPKNTSNSPDVLINLINSNGEKEKLVFHGNLMLYNGNQYEIDDNEWLQMKFKLNEIFAEG